mgnify:CR=1 FL=1
MAHEFKHPNHYRKINMTIDKKLEGKSDLSEKNELLKLASESGAEEFELDLSTGLLKEFEEAVKENPKLKFKDFLSSRRQKLNDGGVTGDTLAENYGDLIDSWVRKIDLASPSESLTEYINRIRKSESKSSE